MRKERRYIKTFSVVRYVIGRFNKSNSQCTYLSNCCEWGEMSYATAVPKSKLESYSKYYINGKEKGYEYFISKVFVIFAERKSMSGHIITDKIGISKCTKLNKYQKMDAMMKV